MISYGNHHHQRLGLDVQLSALVHNFNNMFSIGHLYRARQSMNSLPSQILERWTEMAALQITILFAHSLAATNDRL